MVKLPFSNVCDTILTLKAPSKIAADHTLNFFNFYHSKKIRLDVSCESSADSLETSSLIFS